ncbi:DUF169 domain-containing protein [Vulcanisaeta sp. JCM 16159]|uniref:DUF169 domain-containing protein n=1 Tax=Vulcanisaeta sp. JCM 16159 TaxID=1295371 RepID=UPI0006D1C521|nr:DUF169 domain-containing protein [Vulcanisaeta sp. JCM 16159]
MTVCQVINTARHGRAMAFTLEDMFCIAGAYLFGLVPEYPDFLQAPISRHTISDEAKKRINSRYFENALPEGSVKAVLVAPLEGINFVPDVVDVYGTPTQVNSIAKALIWHGIFPEIDVLGLISCSMVTKAYKTKKPQIKIPGSGEIAWGRTGEDEISIVIPLEHIDKVLSGLEGVKSIYVPTTEVLVLRTNSAQGIYIDLQGLRGVEKEEGSAALGLLSVLSIKSCRELLMILRDRVPGLKYRVLDLCLLPSPP